MAMASFGRRGGRGVPAILGIGAGFLWAASLRADGAGLVEVQCPELPASDVAQVEARIQASRLVEPDPPPVHARCDLKNQRFFVKVGGQTRFVLLAPNRDGIVNVLIDALERALATKEIGAGPTSPSPATPSTAALHERKPAPPPQPASSLRRSRPAARTPVTAPSERPDRLDSGIEPRAGAGADGSWSLEARGISEWQSPAVAWGAGAGVRYRIGPLWCGPTGTLLWANDPDFDARESAVGLDAGLRLRAWWLSAGFGVSHLAVSPRGSDISAEGDSSAVAAYSELRLAYAIPLDRLRFAPGLGVRAFIASRRVFVNGEPRLGLSVVAPAASLALIY
jgi:hypothetical protein